MLAVALGLGLWPRARIPLGALVTGGLLAGFVLWLALSFLWGESAERTLTELNRASLYLGCFALGVLAADRARLLPWLAGTAAGLTAISLVALASRLFPDLTAATEQLAQLFPAAEQRLSYPVDYWNGLATLTAFAVPLLLFLATSARHPLARGLALAPLPALAGTIYLTSSRGGALAATLATLVFVLLSGRRWPAGAAVAVAGAGSVLAVTLLRELTGPSAAFLIALICLATGAAWALGSLFAPSPPRLPRAVRASLLLAIVALAVGGLAAADPRERFERFKEVPPGLAEASVQEHLFSGSGNGRWQLWQVAVDEL
ncbi:MAG: hypothetical protein WD428_02825, partial [Gaiellaceae bacterium]